MTPDELRPILAEYRTRVSAGWSKATAHPDHDAADGSPVGQCGVTSAWLQQRLLEDHRVETYYCVGQLHHLTFTSPSPHCWLQFGRPNYADRVVVDLTADQVSGLEIHKAICSTHVSLAVTQWLYYDDFARLTAADLADDPVQRRLAILKGALS